MPHIKVLEKRVEELEAENEQLKKDREQLKKDREALMKAVGKLLSNYKLLKEMRDEGHNPSIITVEYAYYQIFNRQNNLP